VEEDCDAVVVADEEIGADEDELVVDPVVEEETELVAELVVGPTLKMNASPGKA
jgi:hypothetical protein